MYKYEAALPSNVSLLNGWISIKSVNGTDNCLFLWAGSTSGNLFCTQYANSQWYPKYDQDFAFCLGGGGIQPVPVSPWTLVFGIFLIGVFMIVRYRRRLA